MGYEVSSAGDKRFSAFYARFSKPIKITTNIGEEINIPANVSVENAYQKYVKKSGKGRPPKDRRLDTYHSYLQLWNCWAKQHPILIKELYNQYNLHGRKLTDRFARTKTNQARALTEILSRLEKFHEV